MDRQSPKIFGLAGWSGSGKTTLLRNLLPELISRGITVSTVKHAHSKFDMAQPKLRDFRLRGAGVREMVFAAPARWALLHELEGEPEPSLEDLLPRLSPVDLLLVEGFKKQAHDKLEVHRVAQGKPLLAPNDPHIVAIASEGPIPAITRQGRTLALFDQSETPRIVDFIIRHCGLASRAKRRLRTG